MRIAAILIMSALLVAPASANILGAWSPSSYVLEDGTEFVVSGLIFFTEADWTVLFFVEDAEGEPRRGSAEGGSYRLEGDRLTFTHHYHLSAGDAMGALPEAPLRMSVREGDDVVTESCRIAMRGDALTIYFPSGNRMEFQRSSGF